MHENFAVYKAIQDTVFTLWISDSLSTELGFLIPIVCGILDSLSWIEDSKTQDSSFHKQKPPRIQITLHEEKKLSEKVLDWLSDSLTDWLAFIVFV